MPERHAIRVPDLDLPDAELRVCLWLVPTGTRVSRGDRILELLGEPVIYDISAPADGRLIEKCLQDDSHCAPGDCLGYLLVDGF